MDKVLAKIISDVAEKHGLEKSQVEDIYRGMFKFIREKVSEINFDEVQSEEDLRRIKVNFNIPRIFKLYTNEGRINYAREAIRKSIAKHGERFNARNEAISPESDELLTYPARPDGIESIPEGC